MDKYIIYRRNCKNPQWCVRICCQGQPFYYLYRTLIGAFIGYAYNYYKKHKYGTMTFKLIEYEEEQKIDGKIPPTS